MNGWVNEARRGAVLAILPLWSSHMCVQHFPSAMKDDVTEAAVEYRGYERGIWVLILTLSLVRNVTSD